MRNRRVRTRTLNSPRVCPPRLFGKLFPEAPGTHLMLCCAAVQPAYTKSTRLLQLQCSARHVTHRNQRTRGSEGPGQPHTKRSRQCGPSLSGALGSLRAQRDGQPPNQDHCVAARSPLFQKTGCFPVATPCCRRFFSNLQSKANFRLLSRLLAPTSLDRAHS